MLLSNINPPPQIDILLPAKELFTSKNSGAISNVVYDLVSASTAKKTFTVFGRPVDESLPCINFHGLLPQAPWFHGQNIGFAAAYLNHITKKTKPDLVEVHGRSFVAEYIHKKRPDLKLLLYLHNDPRQMRGTKTVHQRIELLKKMSGIICVSNFIRECYLEGMLKTSEKNDPPLTGKIFVARNGAKRWLKEKPKKEPIVLLAGRMVPEKGILECVEALAETLPRHPEWRLIIAGARRFENSNLGSYEKKIVKTAKLLGDQAQVLGYIPPNELRTLQAISAIAACPSLWQEPISRVVLESLAAGCALLTTRRGGIPEVADGRAIIIDDPNRDNFIRAFEQLIVDEKLRKSLQEKAWKDFPFTDRLMAKTADKCRVKALIGNSAGNSI